MTEDWRPLRWMAAGCLLLWAALLGVLEVAPPLVCVALGAVSGLLVPRRPQL